MSRGRLGCGVLGLVGAGPVGSALALALRDSGWEIGTIASRRIESAETAVALLGSGTPSGRNPDALEGADLVLLAVPDGAIAAVAEELAGSGRVASGLLALHLSGALSSDVLEPVRAAGAVVGSLHPLQTFAGAASAAERLPGTHLFYEGDDRSRIRRVAEDLGGTPVPIEAGAKVLYHAGAAAACNLGAAMIDLGLELFRRAGIEREDALPALLPLLRGTLKNVEQVGLPGALTGPVARGDVETIRGHVAALRDGAPELLPTYAAASLHAVGMGLRKGTLKPAEAEEIRRLLGPAIRDS